MFSPAVTLLKITAEENHIMEIFPNDGKSVGTPQDISSRRLKPDTQRAAPSACTNAGRPRGPRRARRRVRSPQSPQTARAPAGPGEGRTATRTAARAPAPRTPSLDGVRSRPPHGSGARKGPLATPPQDVVPEGWPEQVLRTPRGRRAPARPP